MFYKEYDIVVAGGGIAGVAAALAASRSGARTALVEKTVFPGGLATSGNILKYLPLSDRDGNQVTFGIAEELLHAALKYGPGDIPADWRDPKTFPRYGASFSPASFVLALDELLANENVSVWFDTLICSSLVEAGRIVGIEVENKSGRGKLKAKCFVDATGDADVAFRAGVPCAEQDNFLSIWAIGADLDAAKRASEEKSGQHLLNLQIAGGSDTGVGLPEGTPKFKGTNGRDVSSFILESRKLLRDRYQKWQNEKGKDGRKDVFPITLPSIPNFRTTRRIEGMYTLSSGESGRHFDDCIGVVADWRDGRDIWELPYRALVPKNIDGILTAGRCISTEGEAWEVMRVIPAAAMSGQAAGIAAAMSARKDVFPAQLNVSEIKSTIKKCSTNNYVI